MCESPTQLSRGTDRQAHRLGLTHPASRLPIPTPASTSDQLAVNWEFRDLFGFDYLVELLTEFRKTLYLPLPVDYKGYIKGCR